MKSTVLILLITFGAFICNKSDENIKKTFLGNWSYCDNNGNYTEVHVNERILEWCPEVDPLGIPYNYKLINDSIYIDCLINDTDNRNGKIEKISNNQLLLIFKVSENKFDSLTLIRINQPISFAQDILRTNDTIEEKDYLLSYKKRLTEKSCNKVKKKSLGELELVE
ncbi:MAG: hypothetical protein KAT68_06370 [Bacteroidales bacterium]|nr:hypothetical protein [Bacteroidales bacterium]